jgi:hypothetical protein
MTGISGNSRSAGASRLVLSNPPELPRIPFPGSVGLRALQRSSMKSNCSLSAILVSNSHVPTRRPCPDYDSVKLRSGRLLKVWRSDARTIGEEDLIVSVVKCCCRSHDVITAAEAERQHRPTFRLPAHFFSDLGNLIGRNSKGESRSGNPACRWTLCRRSDG